MSEQSRQTQAERCYLGIAICVAKATVEAQKAIALAEEEGTEYIAEQLDVALKSLSKAAEYNINCGRVWIDENKDPGV